jgi:NADH dehydrogenase
MAITLDSTKLVTIYGGSGFIGRYVVRALARTGARMRIAVRRPDLAGHLQPLGMVGQIHAVQANIRNAESVLAAARGADALVNLVGVLQEGGRQTFDAVQREGARNVAEAAKAADADALVHISAIGADPQSASHYARSKAAGEAALLDVAPGAVILRPSIVFGAEDQFFNRFAALARLSPALPLIGGGHTRFQPVFVGDVARAIVTGLSRQDGRTYELGGPAIYSFKELLQLILRETGRRRLLVPLPFGLAMLKAAFLQILPKPLLTMDQVRLLKKDNVVSPTAPGLAELGITATSVEAVVPAYLWRFHPKGEYASAQERRAANITQ